VSRLVKIPGIVVAASGIKSKATKISLQCRTCRNVIPNIDVKPGLEGYALPRKCNTEQVRNATIERTFHPPSQKKRQ
jgi:DNA replication licensing factor MCM5